MVAGAALAGLVATGATAGAPVYGPPTTVAAGVGQPRQVAVGDFNGDGLEDIAALSPLSADGTTAILYGQPDGSLAAGPLLQLSPFASPAWECDEGIMGTYTVAIAAADVLGDDRDELLATIQADCTAFFLPEGPYIQRQTYLVVIASPGAGQSLTSTLAYTSFEEYFSPGFSIPAATSQMSVADLDGDGDLDVVVPSGFSAVALRNNGGSFTVQANLPVGFDSTWWVHAVDLGGTALPEIVGCDGFTIRVFKPGAGANSYSAGQVLSTPAGLKFVGLASGALNGDANRDLAVCTQKFPSSEGPSSLLRYLGNGDQTLAAPLSSAVPAAARGIRVADTDADGADDVLVTSGNTVRIFAGDGGSTADLTLAGPATNQAWGFDLRNVAPDCRPDLVVAVGNGSSLQLFEGLADPGAPDCNGNGIDDACDIIAGTSADGDGNGVPDECDRPGIVGDLDGNGVVDGADLGLLLAGWGQPGATDLDGNGSTDGADLGLLLANWD